MEGASDGCCATARRSCARTGCTLLLLLITASALLLWSQWRARVADRDAQAPVVIDQIVNGCAMSPNRQFLLLSLTEGDESVPRLYDINAQQWVDLPFADLLTRPGGNLWLFDDQYFIYHTWHRDYTSFQAVNVPEDGFLIDVGARTITDITTLPIEQQAHIIALAVSQLRLNPRAYAL